jgi:protein-disulfide isomerase
MAEESNESTITIRKDALWKYSTFMLLAIVIIGGFIYFGKDSPTTGDVANNPGQPLPPAQAEVTVDNDAVLGSSSAPVTIIEFSDYQCPFCRKFWTETLPSIKREYIDAGKVKLVFRDFPLSSIHPAAEAAAMAAECVREVGKGDAAYYKYHDKIFQEGNILDSGSPSGPVTKTAQFGPTELKKWAKDLGYNIDSCLDSQKYKSEIQKDLSDGASSGVQGTPAFFVNGQLLSGAQPFSAFKQAIDAALA